MTPPTELPAVALAASARRSPAGGPSAFERDRLIRRVKALSWLSLGWMTVEGVVAITAAIVAGSVALLGFGIDSAVEGLASVIIIRRFTGTRRLTDDAERRAQKLVAISFFLLAHTSPRRRSARCSPASVRPPAGSGSACRSRAS